ncbi:hypothetical protein [Rhizobium wenxiniae]|uniref:Uncharacterized protein n=1 Tax=Rhizobium wenxiniae TaxID=1737357 RepID=A0A7W9Y9Y8_9HYPH|nr:hypothetical protein [Rhizobium wenxiniae]MBB6164646.1 hypothetical protein [Rhizobium wenxiniae]GGG06808.1 hypothetical protein GCM10010924_39430 [Rhizobium wenxiniae]
MTAIADWLDDRIQEIIRSPALHDDKADFRDQAKVLVESARADGFSVAEIKEACGGDVERYLLDQQNAMSDVKRQQRLAVDK